MSKKFKNFRDLGNLPTADGRKIKNGVKVALVGKPNTGKSSILNALLAYDKAIVTEIAGTTRDMLEESFSYNGMLFKITDTAGIRESEDMVEQIPFKCFFKNHN